MTRFLISLIAFLILPLNANANDDEKYGSSFEAWEACDEFADQFYEEKGIDLGCEEDIPTNKILAMDEDNLKVIKRFKYSALVYGWVGKFESSFEARQACYKYADQYIEGKGVDVGCEEDEPTNQILALDEDTLKVLKVFKY